MFLGESYVHMVDQQTINSQSTSQQTTGQHPPKASGMISGGAFAGMIIIGGILGDLILYTYLIRVLGQASFLPILILGIVLEVIAGVAIRKATEVSRMLYLLILLGCIGVPLIGGFVLYVIAKKRNLTL